MQQKILISFSEKVVQRTLPNYLQSSIKKHSEINLDDTKALILLDFEMLLQITGHQYFNLTLDIVVRLTLVNRGTNKILLETILLKLTTTMIVQ